MKNPIQINDFLSTINYHIKLRQILRLARKSDWIWKDFESGVLISLVFLTDKYDLFV